MSALRGPWTPAELPKLFLPTYPTEDGGQAANGFDGFTTLAACQAECDARNRNLLESADREVKRLEDALEAAHLIRARTLDALGCGKASAA